MEILASYVGALAVFIVVEAVWIRNVTRPIFERNIGDIMLPDPHFGAALAFFLIYQAGLIYFAVLPAAEAGSWLIAAIHGALLGIIAYGTYETTNLATLKGWTLHMAIVDVAWGAAVSAFVAVAGYFILMLPIWGA